MVVPKWSSLSFGYKLATRNNKNLFTLWLGRYENNSCYSFWGEGIKPATIHTNTTDMFNGSY